MTIISSYLWPFVLSFTIEIAAAIVIGYRNRSMIAGIFFINLMTNPATNFAFRFGCYYHLFSASVASMIGLEITVVIVEWLVLNYIFPGKSRSMFILSLSMNTVSFLIGLLIYYV